MKTVVYNSIGVDESVTQVTRIDFRTAPGKLQIHSEKDGIRTIPIGDVISID